MTRDTLTKLIEKKQAHSPTEVRNYIGASIIGSDCMRQIWYEYKGTESEDVPNKTRRNWAIGKKLEGVVLDWLEATGTEIARLWYDLQSERVPSFKGHLDSVWTINGEAYAIVEVKTAKDSSFNTFVKKGVKLWNPQYYAQVQAYMGMSGIPKAYLIALNKDNSDLSDELILFDKSFYESLEEKAKMIVLASCEPPRVSSSPLWFQCKMCKFNKVCHK